jgi:Holliday junction resolvase-like predicted endonuclease
MGGKSSRNKGKVGEREVCKILGEQLGISLDRNLEQTRDGGCDIILDHWAIEVKRQEKYQVDAWWLQAVNQAKEQGKHPVLFFRKSREDWRVMMPYSLTHDPLHFYVHGDLNLFVERVRED